MSKIRYKRLLEMEEQEYLDFLDNGIINRLNDDYFKKINKELMKGSFINPDKAVFLLKLNLKKFCDLNKPHLSALSLVNITKVHINNKRVDEAINMFSKTIKYVCENGFYDYGEEITDYIMASLHTYLGKIKEDEYIQLMKYQIDFFLRFNIFEKCINLMCEIAFIFASNYAYQPAYRLLNDAQNITMNNNLLDLQLKILITQSTICLQEQDYDAAKTDFDKACYLAVILNSKVPFELMFNMGTLMIRTQKYNEALEIFDRILINYPSIGKKQMHLIKINKSICLREIGRVPEAINLIQEVLEFVQQFEDLEAMLETHLVAAKNYLAAEDYNTSMCHINESMDIMDFDTQYKYRLHYRRGYKENYLSRIIPMVLEIASNDANCKELTKFIAFSKGNVFSDWLSLLDWHDKILADSSVEEVDKDSLKNVIKNLINFGAPILNGFKEKYDDPFESFDNAILNPNGVLDNNKPWKDFNLLVEKISSKYESYGNPYKYSRLSSLQEVVDKKLNNGALILSFYSYNNEFKCLIVSKFNCDVINLNRDVYINYAKDLNNYQNRFVSFSNFVISLKRTIDDLIRDLDSMICSLMTNNIKEIIIMHDKVFHSIPIIPALIDNTLFCEYIKNNEVIIKNAPIIYGSIPCNNHFDNFVGVLDPSDELPLLLEELSLASKHISKNSEIVNLEVEKLDYNSIIVEKADIIHLATHGYPISGFTDPTYGSIAGKLSENSLWFEEIQSNFWKLDYSLCINASCDSSDFTSRNYQRIFNTNELIGYSTLFLMNRKSSAISVNWPIKDIVSYTFSNIFYKNLKEKCSIERAYTLSLINIMELEKQELMEIICSIGDDVIREQKLRLVDAIQYKHPFRSPYCYGAFTINSLI